MTDFREKFQKILLSIRISSEAPQEEVGNVFRPVFDLINANKVRCERNITDEGAYVVGADELYQERVLPQIRPINKDNILERSIPL